MPPYFRTPLCRRDALLMPCCGAKSSGYRHAAFGLAQDFAMICASVFCFVFNSESPPVHHAEENLLIAPLTSGGIYPGAGGVWACSVLFFSTPSFFHFFSSPSSLSSSSPFCPFPPSPFPSPVFSLFPYTSTGPLNIPPHSTAQQKKAPTFRQGGLPVTLSESRFTCGSRPVMLARRSPFVTKLQIGWQLRPSG